MTFYYGVMKTTQIFLDKPAENIFFIKVVKDRGKIKHTLDEVGRFEAYTAQELISMLHELIESSYYPVSEVEIDAESYYLVMGIHNQGS